MHPIATHRIASHASPGPASSGSARWVHAPVSSAREDEKGRKKRRKGARDQVPGLCGIFLCASVPVVRACVACGLGGRRTESSDSISPQTSRQGGRDYVWGTEGGEGRWCGTRRNCKFSGGGGLVVVIESRLNGLCRLPARACA